MIKSPYIFFIKSKEGFNRMKKIWIIFSLSLGILFPISIFCQSPPLGVLPMKFNSSFAGSTGTSRLVSNFSYQNHNNSISGDSYGLALSYDNYFPGIRSGIGITTSGYSSRSTYNEEKVKHQSANVTVVIAPKFSIKGKYTISPSLDFSYINIYSDVLSYYPSWNYGTHAGISSRFGLLFNARNYYIGYSIRIFRSDGLKYLYRNYFSSVLQLGYTFQKSENAKFSFTPQIALPITDESDYLLFWPAYNLSFRYQKYIIGLIGYDYVPSGIQLGWQNNGWRLLLSNEFGNTYRANLSMRYIFNIDKKSLNILY